MLSSCCCRHATRSCSRARAIRARSPPATLESLCGQLAGPPSEVVAEPAAALERARKLAGEDGVVLVAGSIYLLSDLARRRADGASEVRVSQRAPSWPACWRWSPLLVAFVILVFFGIGYGLGRLLL